jgi:DNA-binding response OmpR family regulator
VATSLSGSEIPDLILADWRLGKGLTGGDVAQAVQDHFGEDIPLLILTGEDNEVVRDITNQGYVVIRKPARVNDLLKYIAHLIK